MLVICAHIHTKNKNKQKNPKASLFASFSFYSVLPSFPFPHESYLPKTESKLSSCPPLVFWHGVILCESSYKHVLCVLPPGEVSVSAPWIWAPCINLTLLHVYVSLKSHIDFLKQLLWNIFHLNPPEQLIQCYMHGKHEIKRYQIG